MLLVAAAALALEALALLVVTVLDVIDITSGRSYQAANGFALVILQLIMIVGLGMLASGALKLRPWTRTPAVMVQVLTGVVAVILLQAGRPEWGVPTAVLAVAGLVGLLAPASLKALARPRPED
jgi:hypothetical protein